MSTPSTVDEYLAGFDGQARERLTEVRELALRAAPGATESLKWHTPAYSLRTILFQFSGHAQHLNVVFTPSTRETFDAELADFATGKGSVKLPYTEPLPVDLLERMMAYRIRECEIDGVNWM